MLLNAKLSAIEQERGQLFDTIFHLRKNTLLHDYATPSIQFHNLKCMYIPSMLTRKPYVEMILHIRLRSNSNMCDKSPEHRYVVYYLPNTYDVGKKVIDITVQFLMK